MQTGTGGSASADQQTVALAAQVVVPGVPSVLSYSLPGQLSRAQVGAEVVVDVGNREATGWIVELISASDAEQQLKSEISGKERRSLQVSLFGEAEFSVSLKPVRELREAFLPDQMKMFSWMAEYYGVPLAEVLETALPRRSDEKSVKFIEPTPVSEGAGPSEKIIKGPSQIKLLQLLRTYARAIPMAQALESSGASHATVKALEKKNLVRVFERTLTAADQPELLPAPIPGHGIGNVPEALTSGQAAALIEIEAALAAGRFAPLLLFGVTGSGKTEVYLRALQRVLSGSGSALLIVPEIALTPQLLDTLQARLEHPLAVLHSQVGSRARWSSWEALHSGEVRLAIGARSAIFAPLRDLQLIIVDEEHESSYKQSEGLRYHGRDLAVIRAKFSGCPVILGSATPSFESLLNVRLGRYKMLELPERVTRRELPQIEIVDMRKIKRRDMPSENISPELHRALSETLEAREQTVILYNRRGFSSYLQCDTCGEVVACPNCSVALTYHRKREKLVCHYCSLTIAPPALCPVCRDPATSQVDAVEDGAAPKVDKIGSLTYRGAGTERVVDELAQLYPEARIVRMDRDTVGKKDAYREILGDMRSRKADILVGTQMIAKGHDLPGVTLVGIIDADVGLHIPDFRSSEKTFQLITQAAGRAGRGELPGRVIVQTRESDHPTIVAVVTGRFKAFARYQLEQRKSLEYPPFGRLLRAVISSTDSQEALQAAANVKTAALRLSQHLNLPQKDPAPKIAVLGPAPAPHEKLRGRYRWHILIKANSARAISHMASALNDWKTSQTQFKDFRLTLDVDPFDML